MRECELCGSRARTHCESDQASLCWDCDEKVHGANFLVAKHSRSLLCHVCRSPTPWKASGPKLTPTVSVCEACVGCRRRRFARGRANNEEGDGDGDGDDEDEESQAGNEESDDEDEDEDEEDGSEDDGCGDFDEDGENQVVPWSFSSSSPPAYEGASSSSEDQEAIRFSSASKVRSREINADQDSDDETTSSGSFRSLKRPRLSEENAATAHINHNQSESPRSTAIITSLQRLQNDAVAGAESDSATILEICKLSRDQNR